MLTTVQKIINDSDDVPFDAFYQNYVVSVQDSNLNRELSHLNINTFKQSNEVEDCLNKLERGLIDAYIK